MRSRLAFSAKQVPSRQAPTMNEKLKYIYSRSRSVKAATHNKDPWMYKWDNSKAAERCTVAVEASSVSSPHVLCRPVGLLGCTSFWEATLRAVRGAGRGARGAKKRAPQPGARGATKRPGAPFDGHD